MSGPGRSTNSTLLRTSYDPLAPFVIDWPSEKALGYYLDQTQGTDSMLAKTGLDASTQGMTRQP